MRETYIYIDESYSTQPVAFVWSLSLFTIDVQAHAYPSALTTIDASPQPPTFRATRWYGAARKNPTKKNAMMVFKRKSVEEPKQASKRKKEATKAAATLPPPYYGRRSKIARANILQLLHSR